MYAKIVDSTFTWENFTIEAQAQAQIFPAGRSNNYLDTIQIKTLSKCYEY